jgi:hypothetical protein
VVRKKCSKRIWLKARLDTGFRFSLQIRHILPRGTWQLRTRATDGTGKQEPVRNGTNSVRLKLV